MLGTRQPGLVRGADVGVDWRVRAAGCWGPWSGCWGPGAASAPESSRRWRLLGARGGLCLRPECHVGPRRHEQDLPRQRALPEGCGTLPAGPPVQRAAGLRASQPWRGLLPGEPRPHGPWGLAQPGLPRPHSPGWASQRGREGAAVDVNTGCVCGTWVTSTLSPRSRWCACVHVRVCACVGECDRRAGTECRASSGSRAPGQSGGALGSGVGSRAPGGPLCAASQGRVSTAQTVSRAGSGADPRAAGPSCRAHWRPWCLGVCGQEDGAGGWGPHAPGP